jgi:hypothetical protein
MELAIPIPSLGLEKIIFHDNQHIHTMSSANLLQTILLKWKYYHFESASYIGEDFKLFAKEFKMFLKDIMHSQGGELLVYSRGHFEVSAFVQRSDGQIIYISLSDARQGPNAFDRILYRTAQHTKDYTGGHNNHTSVEDLSSAISNLRSYVQTT